MSDNLKSVIEESAISQMFITIIVMVGALVVQLQQGQIPDWMQFVVASLVGFYFGAKSSAMANKDAVNVQKRADSDAAAAAPPAASGSVTTVVTTALDAQPNAPTGVIDVAGGIAQTSVQAGSPVSEVNVSTATRKPTRKPVARKPAKRAWTKIRPPAKKKVKR